MEINKEEIIKKWNKEMKCIHKIAINFHCPYCWELMKKLYQNPDNKKIVRITDYKKLKTSKVKYPKRREDK